MDIKIKSKLANDLFTDKKFSEGCILGGLVILSGIIMLFFKDTQVLGPALIGFGMGFLAAVYNNYTKQNGDNK